jgi:tetratricopeptide (TPR) repeat protein
VLQHVRLGRRVRPGFDRAAAVASYRKAKELDPKDVITRADLAILLEHDAYGTRYSERADTSAAIAEYVALEKELKDTRFHRNLLIALATAGRFAELREAARGSAGVAAQDEFLVLAAAALDGAPAAIAEAGRLVADPPTRRQRLESVGRTLATFRRYPEAAALLEAAATDAPDSAGIRSQVAVLKKTRRYEEALPPQDDPRSALPRFIVLFSEPAEPDARALAAVFSKDALKDMDAHDEDFVRIVRALRSPIRATGLPRAVLLDLAISVMQLSVDGAPETGWRVRMRGAGDTAAVTETYFVVREDGVCRVVSAAKLPGQLGAEVLRRLARGDAEGARRWLDWARDEANTGAGDDPFSGAPFIRFWTKGRAETPERMRLAAAVLAAEGAETAPKALPILEEARRAASGSEASDLDAALATAYERLNRDSDLLEAARRLLVAAPESRRAFVITSLALHKLKRFDEAEKLADERLARIADDPTALRVLADLARDAGRFARSRSAQERLVATGAAEAPDLNNMAWSALFDGTSLDEALTNAQRAVELTRKKSSAELNTLACLHAEAGHTLEARELALAAMDEGWRDEPEDADWYVLGRLAEQYGERDAALAAYRKVEKPRKSVGLASSPWTLAQRRLAALSGPS